MLGCNTSCTPQAHGQGRLCAGQRQHEQLLERLLQGEIKIRFASNVVQDHRFSDMLAEVIQRYQNRSIETAQVMEALIAIAKKFREAADCGE